MNAFLGGLRTPVNLRGVARVGVQEHELADVVQKARNGQTVAVLIAHFARDTIGGLLGGESVQAEALRSALP